MWRVSDISWHKSDPDQTFDKKRDPDVIKSKNIWDIPNLVCFLIIDIAINTQDCFNYGVQTKTGSNPSWRAYPYPIFSISRIWIRLKYPDPNQSKIPGSGTLYITVTCHQSTSPITLDPTCLSDITKGSIINLRRTTGTKCPANPVLKYRSYDKKVP